MASNRDTGVVLPICLMFLFLIAQIAIAAFEMSALNQATVSNLTRAEDINKAERQASAYAWQHLSVYDDDLPFQSQLLSVAGEGEDEALPDYSFSYRFEQAADDFEGAVQGPQCEARHRVTILIHDREGRSVRARETDHYHCCAEAVGCTDPDLSVWLRAH